jgi:hypothetical protein
MRIRAKISYHALLESATVCELIAKSILKTYLFLTEIGYIKVTPKERVLNDKVFEALACGHTGVLK